MAEVLTIREIECNAPFTEYRGSYKYGNYIYINTKNSIYVYDIVNNIYTLKINKTQVGYGTLGCVGVDNKIYIVRYGTYDTFNFYYWYDLYDISSNSITYDIAHWGFGYDSYKWYNRGIPYKYGSKICTNFDIGLGSYADSRVLFYNIDTNSYSYSSRKFGDNMPSNGQYTDNYFFSSFEDNKSTIKYNNNYGIMPNVYSLQKLGTWNIIHNYSSFKKDNDIYIIGGNEYPRSVTKYNVQTSIFETLNITLPFDVINRTVSGDNNFYIFGTNSIILFEFIDYNLNYKIANNSGDNIYVELTGQSPITKIRFNYNLGNDQVGYVMTTLTGDVTGSYTPNIPEGYKLIGFGYSPNASSSSVIAPLNTDVSVSIDSDFTFYEVYGIYRPPATTFDINLYQNTSEGNRVDKTNYLTQVGTISGALRSSTSINDLVITYESKSIPNFNYVYIPIFNRYYFVDDITSENYSLWTLALSVDPLMTYKEAILNCNGFVDRCESDFNANIIDKKRVVEEGNTIEVDTVTNELFTNTSGTYIMTALLVGFDNTEA